LLGHRICQRFALQILVSIHPLLELDNFKWIGGSGERLSQELIWIKSDRRNQGIQFTTRKLRRLFRVRGCCIHDLRLRLLCQCAGAQRDECETNDGDYRME
jgi:hypothetical protein